MKRLLFAGVIITSLNYNAQVNFVPRTCGTPILPQQYETWVQGLTSKNTNPGKYGSATAQSAFNIPVIVHVIHNNETLNNSSATSGGNLNAAQIIDQINILNKDFNGLNADTNLIPSAFKPVLGKFQVNFCLAVVNPTGGILAEPGIDRINRVSKSWSAPPYSQTYITSTIKPNSIWDPNKYLNIWVCALGNSLLGYATFPNPGNSGIQGLSGTYGTSTTDGVVILNTAFGSIGTGASGQYNKGRTVTHEIGHWMGLRHIWGDGSCATDYCTDTPPAQTANYGCPSYPFNTGVCTGNTTGEMTMNFMDYTDDACMYMFTMDQKFRAQLILTNSAIRSALITSTVCNLPTVGNDIGISSVASPSYSQTFVCQNTINPVVNITNYGSTTLTSALLSYNIDGSSTQTLSWTGSASPNTSFTLALGSIGYSTAGSHVLNVSASSPNGSTDNNPNNNVNLQNFYVLGTMTVNAPSPATCLGTPVIVTASGATSYSWSSGITTASISLNPSATTIYTVVGVTGLCTASRVVTVTVQSTPTIILSDSTVCEGTPLTITAQGASTYNWNSGTNILSGSSITINLTLPATYTITGATTAGCTSSVICNISIAPSPSISLMATHVSCASCQDATISVTPLTGTPPYTYFWSPVVSTSSIVANVSAECYQVEVTDALGCKTLDSVCVSFDTGILNEKITDVSTVLLPNPTKGIFEITFSDAQKKTIEIMDSFGCLLKVATVSSDSYFMDISSYPVGVYYVRVLSDNKSRTTKILKN